MPILTSICDLGKNYRLGKNHSLEIYKIIAGSVPDHLNKEAISINCVTKILGFSVHKYVPHCIVVC